MPATIVPPAASIAAVIATVGRPSALEVCLRSLAAQTVVPAEVIVVHSGADAETKAVCDQDWAARGLPVSYHPYPQKSAALQRDFAVRRTRHPFVLFSDDDMEYSRTWVQSLLAVLQRDAGTGAVMGAVDNHPMGEPTLLFRVYRWLVAGPGRAHQPGAVVGAAVHNGFPLDAREPIASEWISGCTTLLRRSAYLSVGGFAPYFRGSSPGEDVDLGYRISRQWRIYYVPTARCLHHQAASGRDKVGCYQHLYMRSRYAFCRRNAGFGAAASLGHILLWALFQTASELSQLRHGTLPRGFLAGCRGRLTGGWSCLGWTPQTEQFPGWHLAMIQQ